MKNIEKTGSSISPMKLSLKFRKPSHHRSITQKVVEQMEPRKESIIAQISSHMNKQQTSYKYIPPSDNTRVTGKKIKEVI